MVCPHPRAQALAQMPMATVAQAVDVLQQVKGLGVTLPDRSQLNQWLQEAGLQGQGRLTIGTLEGLYRRLWEAQSSGSGAARAIPAGGYPAYTKCSDPPTTSADECYFRHKHKLHALSLVMKGGDGSCHFCAAGTQDWRPPQTGNMCVGDASNCRTTVS